MIDNVYIMSDSLCNRNYYVESIDIDNCRVFNLSKVDKQITFTSDGIDYSCISLMIHIFLHF